MDTVKPTLSFFIIVFCLVTFIFTLHSDISHVQKTNDITVRSIDYDHKKICGLMDEFAKLHNKKVEVDEIKVTDPFKLQPSKPSPQEIIPDLLEEPVIPGPDFILKGVLIDGNNDIAIIQLSDGTTIFSKIGDNVQGYELKSITKHSICFIKSQTEFILNTE
ncbi:MAG: hypothetical protein AB1765_02265 [Candidatus Hydrogenedentota bacterium]